MSHGTVYTEELLDHVEREGQRSPDWPAAPAPRYEPIPPMLRTAKSVVATFVPGEDEEQEAKRQCTVCRRHFGGLRALWNRPQCSARCASIAASEEPS